MIVCCWSYACFDEIILKTSFIQSSSYFITTGISRCKKGKQQGLRVLVVLALDTLDNEGRCEMALTLLLLVLSVAPEKTP